MTNAPSVTDATTAPIAPISRRAIAYVIDAAIASALSIVGIVVSVVVSGTGGRDLSAALVALVVGLGITALVLVAWLLVYSFLQGAAGSIGMRAMGLRLVREEGNAPLGFGRALLRNVVFGLAATIVVGYFSPLFDGSGRFQGWHDRASGALMRDVRSPAPPAAPAAVAPHATSGTSSFPAQAAAGPATSAPVLSGVSSAFSPPPSAAPTGHTLPHAPGAEARSAVESPEATVLSARTPEPNRSTTVDGSADEAMITTVPGVSPAVAAPAPTIVSGPESAAPSAPPAPAPAPVPVTPVPVTPVAAPVIAQTAEDDDLEETRISIPGHRLQFVWDDGARATVSGRTLFGRNPAAEAGAAVVVVRDETLSLSKTHFEAAAESAGGWVMDRHSTNGMTIVRDGVRIACPPGERVRIRLGDAIEIGDRIVTVGGYA